MRRHEMAGCHMIPSEPRPLITDNAESDLVCRPIWRTSHLLGIRAGHCLLRAASTDHAFWQSCLQTTRRHPASRAWDTPAPLALNGCRLRWLRSSYAPDARLCLVPTSSPAIVLSLPTGHRIQTAMDQ